MATKPGLRERKHVRVQIAIQRAALELALEKGAGRTTVAEIAERAGVSPRTIYTRFPTKDAILLAGLERLADGAIALLHGAPGGIAERLAAFLHGADLSDEPIDLHYLRQQAVHTDPDLRLMFRAQLDRVEVVIAEEVARETGCAPGSTGPRTCAAAAIGLLIAVNDHFVREPHDEPAVRAGADQGLVVFGAAIEALRLAGNPKAPNPPHA